MKNMIYTVEFYSKMREEVLMVPVEALNRNMAVDAVCRYYMADHLAVRSVKDTPEATPKLKVCRIPKRNM